MREFIRGGKRLFEQHAIVIGPTPPGTGVIRLASSAAASYSTSPTLPGLYPASSTTAPGLIHSPRMSSGRPDPVHGRVVGERRELGDEFARGD